MRGALDTFGTLVLFVTLLHAPDGREIYIYNEAITSLRAHIPGEKNVNVPHSAKCVVNLSDGKFVSVIETCEEVLRLIRQSQDQQRDHI